MNKKKDLEHVLNTLDFESVGARLETLVKTGNIKKRVAIKDILDKIKPSLLKARENSVSCKAITEYLIASGIQVSEPTLRQYLNSAQNGAKQVGKSKNNSKKPTRKNAT